MLEGDAVRVGTAAGGHGDGERAIEILGGVALALGDNPSTQSTGIRTYLYHLVGSMENVLIVLHHDDGIAQVTQLLQSVDETVSVTTVQTYGRFVENVERAYERRTQYGGEIHSLALAPRQRVGRTVESEVPQSYIIKVVQARGNLGEEAGGDF